MSHDSRERQRAEMYDDGQGVLQDLCPSAWGLKLAVSQFPTSEKETRPRD